MTNIRKTILLVEDDQSLLEMLRLKFEKADLNVLTASDGQAGLRLALAKRPDLIILDLLLPEVDGVTVLKKLRADAWGKTVPVIVATNVEHIPALNQCLEAGVADYYVKADVELKDLVANVKNHLETPTKNLPPRQSTTRTAS